MLGLKNGLGAFAVNSVTAVAHHNALHVVVTNAGGWLHWQRFKLPAEKAP